ncbi:MAG: hypothetical protein LBE74_02145 [Treponema sp.]|jgi:Tfp pilus assembly protein PilN|nr:hypothetical protein [Treponema sp.]
MKQTLIVITAALVAGAILGLVLGNSFFKQEELREKDIQITALQEDLESANQEIERLKADSARLNQQLSNIRAVLGDTASTP